MPGVKAVFKPGTSRFCAEHFDAFAGSKILLVEKAHPNPDAKKIKCMGH